MNASDYEALLPHATPAQARNVRAWLKHGSQRKAAQALGVNPRAFTATLQSLRRTAAASDPNLHGEGAPEGYHLEGASTYTRNANGDPVWIKTQRDSLDPDTFANAVEAALSCLPPAPRIVAPKRVASHLCNVMPIGDPHFGMLAWPPETGEAWDLEIASASHAKAIARLMAKAPRAQRALVVWMGDNSHADDVTALTPTSKHSLDVDSRWERVIGILFTSMINSVTVALRTHAEVFVRIVKGNHDPHVAAALALALEAYFRTDPRVHVERAPTPLYVTTWGRVLLAFTHGHAPAPARVPDILAADYRKEIGATEQGYLYTGHRHNKMLSERGGLVMEAVQTLSAKDAYATTAGFRSARGLFVETFDDRLICPTDRAMVAAQDLPT